jgi:hypothetical protein
MTVRYGKEEKKKTDAYTDKIITRRASSRSIFERIGKERIVYTIIKLLGAVKYFRRNKSTKSEGDSQVFLHVMVTWWLESWPQDLKVLC